MLHDLNNFREDVGRWRGCGIILGLRRLDCHFDFVRRVLRAVRHGRALGGRCVDATVEIIEAPSVGSRPGYRRGKRPICDDRRSSVRDRRSRARIGRIGPRGAGNRIGGCLCVDSGFRISYAASFGLGSCFRGRAFGRVAIAATSMLGGAIVGRIVGGSEEPAVGAAFAAIVGWSVGTGMGFSVGATVGAVVGAIVGATVAGAVAARGAIVGGSVGATVGGAVTIGAGTAMRSACAGACATIFASSGRCGRVRRVMGFGVKIGRDGVVGRSVGCAAGVACATTAASVGAMVGATRFCTARSCVKANDCMVVSFGSAARRQKCANYKKRESENVHDDR